VHGCSTKWKEKRALVAQDEEKWQKGTVTLEPITAAAVSELRKNATAKLRVINVWATWCSPCVEEFPELVKTQRKFALRDFELITISLDDKKDLAKVKQFLEEKNAILPDKLKKSLAEEKRLTNHYLYAEDSQEDLIKALDPEWQGPIPFTLIITPGGLVIQRLTAPITEGDKLRQMLLDYMGRGYTKPGSQLPGSSVSPSANDPNTAFKSAVESFMSGNISASLASFNRLIQIDANAKPALWQRGIALYYADQFAEGSEQFEVHQSVNPEDVENAAWHFLCVARDQGLAEARQRLITIKGDSRVPMKEIFQLFSGLGTEEQVLKAAEQGADHVKKNQLCYAHLYLGLYAEACGDAAKAKQHMSLAAHDYAMNHYMGEVARVHLKVRGW
jgi:lipoprotein NlpI